jgi:hypothetical protein
LWWERRREEGEGNEQAFDNDIFPNYLYTHGIYIRKGDNLGG